MEVRAQLARGGEAIDYYASFYKEGLEPKAAVGWEEPDAQTAFANGDVAMLIAGGWTYNSIIATKPDLEKDIGTVLTPAGPSGKNTAFAGGSHLVQFQESKNKDLGAAFVDFMLEPAQLNKFTCEIGFLPGTTDGIEAAATSTTRPQAVRRAAAEQLAVYPPSPKWGGLEGANIFDGEIQKVMKGQETAQQAVQNLAKQDGRGVRRRMSTAPAAVTAGRTAAPRGRRGGRDPPRGGAADAAGADAAAGAGHHRRAGRLSAGAHDLPVVHRHRPGRADLRRRDLGRP